MPIIKLSVSERRRLSVFFFCLLLALVAWVFTTLSGTYNFTVRQALTFKNAPQRRAFKALQPDTVETVIQGTGWQMLFLNHKPSNQTVTIDLHTLEHSNFIALNTQIAQINRKKDAAHKIISFNPDTLYFDFTNRVIKKVKVEPALHLDYQKQFAPSGNVVVNPAYVTLNGPDNVIKGITVWKTDSLMRQGVNNPVKAMVKLQSVKEANLSVYPKMVQVYVQVEEFTEKTLNIPVKLVNNTHYYNVKIFPQYVKATFTVPLSRYTELDENFFEATADFSLWEQGYSVLPVTVSRLPDYCKLVTLTPRNIDFLVKK